MNLKWLLATEKGKVFLGEHCLIQTLYHASPGHFFFSQSKPSQGDASEQVAQLQEEKVYQSKAEEDLGDLDEDEEARFQMLMDKLGAQNVLEE